MGPHRMFIFLGLTVAIVLLAFPVLGNGSEDMATRAVFVGGDGSRGDPYQIADLDGLQHMSANLDAHYILAGNVDAAASSSMNGGLGFLPIGDDTTSFTGSLEGRGFKISSLFMDRGTLTNVGLFGYIDDNAYIGNVTLSGCSITGDNNVGSIVGTVMKGVMFNCTVKGEVGSSGGEKIGGLIGSLNRGEVIGCISDADVRGHLDVGGLIGSNTYGRIEECSSDGETRGDIDVGGLIGYNQGVLSDCHTHGGVFSSGDKAGGLIGYSYFGKVTRSYSESDVTGTGVAYGGLVGTAGYGYFHECFSTGSIIADSWAGGFAGTLQISEMSQCYSTGDVTAGDNTGGLIGYMGPDGDVTNCYSTGDVTGSNNVGGLIGNMEGMVSYSYSAGSVLGGAVSGGLIGYREGVSPTACYWDTETSGMTSSQGGLGRTTVQMMSIQYYSLWDMKEVWSLFEGESYPYLLCYYEPPRITFSGDTRAMEDELYHGSFQEEISVYPSENSFKMRSITLPPWLDSEMMMNFFSGTPTNDDIGNYEISFQVSDRISTTTIVVSIEVVNVNDPPVINTTDVVEAYEDELYIVEYSAEDIDPTGDTLTWTLETDAGWLSISGSGVLHGLPGENEVGEYHVVVNVSDGQANDSHEFNLTVLNVNDPPVISPIPEQEVLEDSVFLLDLEAFDQDTGDELEWKLVRGPAWLGLNGSELNGTPTNDNVGLNVVEVEVRDEGNATDSVMFIIDVVNVNDAPYWIKYPVGATLSYGAPFFGSCLAGDVDIGDELRYWIDSTPHSNIYIDNRTGAIHMIGAVAGTYLVTLEASDGEAVVSMTFSIVVKAEEGDDDDNDDIVDDDTTDDDSVVDDDTTGDTDGKDDGWKFNSLSLLLLVILVIVFIALLVVLLTKRGKPEGTNNPEE